ncbi:uncharacterized protein V3H82_004298 [Fundulus diaphanus]
MADKELARVRGRFVEKISKALIKQLLDDLLEDRLLNDGETDSVLEDNTGKADMARCLIDMVRKKGDKASRTMIEHLKQRDPTLYSELGLTDTATPAPQKQQGWSNTLLTTTDSFWNEKRNSKDVYSVSDSSLKSRVALLITNRNFSNTRLTRKGAEKDEEYMEKLLRSLNYEVVKYNDLTAERINEALRTFKEHPKLSNTDSVFVVIMSHGKREFVLGVNHSNEKPDEFPIDNIYKYLGPQECPALMNKPKIIIIQACRGASGGSVIVSDSASAETVSDDVSQQQPASVGNIVDDAIQYVHKEKDFISLLSSTPDTVSYRREDMGSFLIQYIAEVFNTCSHEDDIDELFRKVMQRFEEFPDETKRQMPTKDRCTLTRRFYLFPGHCKELTRVRANFVGKVSKAVIKQLLDDLLEDRLLNDGEVDSVLEDNTGRADMARCLIDIVRKKGDKASRKMIEHIESRDSALYSELELSSGPKPVAAPKRQKTWSDKLVPMTDSLRQEKMNDSDIYRVSETSLKSRVALLITNRNFTDTNLTRKGAEKDEENMEELLSSLQYEVVKHNDLTAKNIEKALREFTTHPKLKDTDSVFVVIMSHGKRGVVLGVDHRKDKPDEFPVDNIYKFLGPQKCSALMDKPKIIIIQACRGATGGAVIVSDSVEAEVVSDEEGQAPPHRPGQIVEDSLRYVHKEKDFISLLSSTPDTVSYRREDLGSFLIQYIAEVFNTCSHEDDIDELFRKVMQRFEEFPDETKRQMPTKDRCTLTRRFYLFPGH